MSADSNGVELVVEVRVSPQSRIVVGQVPWGPNVMMDGKFYPGCILGCAQPIPPGATGRITLGILIGDNPESIFASGTEFELRDGPSVHVADAVVIGKARFRP